MIVAEAPNSEAQVLPKLVSRHPDTLLTREFFDLFDAAKLPERRESRFFLWHARGQVAFNYAGEMLPDLLRHFRVTVLFSKEPEQTAKPGAELWHKG